MMKGYYPRQPGAAAIAVASASVIMLSYIPFKGNQSTDSSCIAANDSGCARNESAKEKTAAAAMQVMTRQKNLQTPALISWRNPLRVFGSTAKCEGVAMLNDKSTNNPLTTNNESDGTQDVKLDYYYVKMSPSDIERTSLLDSHAIFGALLGEGLVERYNVYQRVNLEGKQQHVMGPSKRELTVVDLKLGHRLNGHGGIVHGGIISLLFDEAMGWAYECLQEESQSTDTTAVTANLTVDFRAPFIEGSEGVVRVYHDESKSKGRKMYFSASLESMDGSVVFAEAKSLFILVKSDRLNSK